jgi:hypothetical protein
MMNALVYTHTFSDGSVYFGNAVNPNRPFTKGGRGSKYLTHLEKHGEPVVKIVISNISIDEADLLEQALFDRYVKNEGIKLQSRPSGTDLRNQVNRNSKIDHSQFIGSKRSIETCINISESQMGKSLSSDHKRAISEGLLGNIRSETSARNVNTAVNLKRVYSTYDGRVTSLSASGHWNKKNPNYIGTWVEVTESEATNGK